MQSQKDVMNHLFERMNQEYLKFEEYKRKALRCPEGPGRDQCEGIAARAFGQHEAFKESLELLRRVN